MAKYDYNHHLKQVPLFADLDDRELERVSQTATDLDFPAGRTLMSEGTFAHEMFVVVSGTVEVTRDGEHIADIDAGGFAGEMALINRSRRNSTVTAKTDVELIHIDGRSFSTLMNDVPSLAIKMLPVVAGRVTDNSEHHSH